jgi:conjugative transfer region lipoprotein (TIGR03751 family)
MRTQHCLNLIVWISLVLLTGCTIGEKHMIPQKGLTVQQIYQHSGSGAMGYGQQSSHYGDNGDDELNQARAAAHDSSSPQAAPHEANQNNGTVNGKKRQAPSRESSPDIQREGTFKQLQNPSVSIYIMPHFVRMGSDEVPVAGYSTSFFLYSKNHYALPWESY